MSSIESGVALNAALTRQAVGLEVLKSSAALQQKTADILLGAVLNVPVAGSRGAHVNISA